MALNLILAMTLIALSSCGIVQKVAVNTTGNLLFDATEEIETEGNMKIFADAIPGNLKMMEGLLFLEPLNSKILVGLSKGYAGLAFAVNETGWMHEKYQDIEDGPHRQQMILNYSKALDFGLRFLEGEGISFNDLKSSMNKDNGIVELLEENLDDDTLSLEGALFTAQAMGSLILAQMNSMTMVAHLPIVKGIFDWVCVKKPDLKHGACDIFYGAYEAARPRMLGGNPEKGKKIFQEMFKKYPHNWIGRTAYIRFYLIPMADEDGYKEQKFLLQKAKSRFDASRGWKPLAKDYPEFSIKGLLLYQSLAMKRFEIIKKYEKDLF